MSVYYTAVIDEQLTRLVPFAKGYDWYTEEQDPFGITYFRYSHWVNQAIFEGLSSELLLVDNLQEVA